MAVVEREGLGGTCVLWGCIPAKALLESAALANRVKHAKDFGVNVGEVTTDYGVAMKRSRAVSLQNSKGVEFLFKKNKITWIKGTAKLAGKNGGGGEDAPTARSSATRRRRASSSRTGSRVKGLPQIGLELNKTTVLSSDDVLIAEKAPKTMAVIGAGAVGCEFADVFNAFGTQVTLIEVLPTVLPIEDADVSAELAKCFRRRKIDIVTGARIAAAKVGKDSVTSPSKRRRRRRSWWSRVLVAAGRAPNVEEIGLKEAGVQLALTSTSSISGTVGSTSMSVTSVPKALSTSANSQPTAPAPMSAIVSAPSR